MVFNLADSNIFYLKEIARVTCDLWAIEGRSRYLRLHLNWLQTNSGNDFPENGGVWLLLQIRSNWKAFPVDRIWEPKQQKWFSVSIFTSNYFRPWKIEERERERVRERERQNRSRHHRPPTSPAGAVAPIAIAIAISASIFARCVDLRAIAIDASRESVDRDQCIAPLTSPTSAVALITIAIVIFASFFVRSRSRSTHHANTSIAIAIALSVDRSDWFFLGFVCILRNKWYYIIVW